MHLDNVPNPNSHSIQDRLYDEYRFRISLLVPKGLGMTVNPTAGHSPPQPLKTEEPIKS